MFSIRNTFALGLIVAGIAGCQVKQPGQPVALNDKPLIVDDAMQHRDWDATAAVYANGKVPAGADRFKFEASDSTVEDWGWASETPLFVANSIVLPFTFITTPPLTRMENPSVTTPVSYTAVPPLETVPSYGFETRGVGNSGTQTASK